MSANVIGRLACPGAVCPTIGVPGERVCSLG
jgi:hypothetical protein